MATRLQEVVTATAVPAGGSVSIAHHINVDGVAKIPDYIDRDNRGFAGVSATTAAIVVRNDTTAAADISLRLRYYHTIDRVYGSKSTLALTPDPWWDGGAASSVSASVIDEFVYQPGGAAAGPSVFASFADLYTALVAARTAAGGNIPITLGFDASLGAVAIPAGTYDFTNVTQVGLGGGQTAISYADGTVFTGARRWRNLIVTNQNTTTPPISDIANGDQFMFENTVVQTTTGVTVAMFRQALTGGQSVTFWFTEGSTLGGTETGRVISVGNFNHQTRIKLDSLSSIVVPSAISSGGFATPVLVITAPAMAQVPTAFVNWAIATGYTTPGPTLTGPASLLPMPFLGTAYGGALLTPDHGQWLRLTSSGSSYQQDLPAISTVSDGAAGTFLLVTDESTSNNQLMIAPAAGDTIDGSATARGVPRGGGILLVSNGVSKWSVVAAWGLNRMTLPYVWHQDNVAAAQAAVALNPQPATFLFADFMTMRNGSVVGLSARFTELITVAGATLTVTINGVATPLAVTVLDGSTSATMTLFAGTVSCNYVAGDRIGVTITTTGGFAPNTTDVECIVEIEECP